MSSSLNHRLTQLQSSAPAHWPQQIRRGIEKESLRVDRRGQLAMTDHPIRLGSAMTHPHITTDYAEALLEFITDVHQDLPAALAQLDTIQRFTYQQLDQELLWTSSMPCVLHSDEQIPIARYGSSTSAQMKQVYRLGLGHRYGRAMQTIAGVHYNFSLPDALWPALAGQPLQDDALQTFITDGYFSLIRNFRRHAWLQVYLFGASPALCQSFLGQRPHQLEKLGRGTLYLPYATSLRMGDLGYSSAAQNGLQVCYNQLDSYIETLRRAITESHPAYQAIGVRDANGNYQQLSDALLQIENEFYSPIRPKRVTLPGETPLSALKRAGVQYIEVRAVDIDPFDPRGISEAQGRFIDLLLLHSLLSDSPSCGRDEVSCLKENLKRVVEQGRAPGLLLQRQGTAIPLQQWGEQLLEEMEPIAELLDRDTPDQPYRAVLNLCQARLQDASLTPSAQVLAEVERLGSYFAFALQQSERHAQHYLQQPLTTAQQAQLEAEAQTSLQRLQQLEAEPQLPLEQYLANYFAQYQALAVRS